MHRRHPYIESLPTLWYAYAGRATWGSTIYTSHEYVSCTKSRHPTTNLQHAVQHSLNISLARLTQIVKPAGTCRLTPYPSLSSLPVRSEPRVKRTCSFAFVDVGNVRSRRICVNLIRVLVVKHSSAVRTNLIFTCRKILFFFSGKGGVRIIRNSTVFQFPPVVWLLFGFFPVDVEYPFVLWRSTVCICREPPGGHSALKVAPSGLPGDVQFLWKSNHHSAQCCTVI